MNTRMKKKLTLLTSFSMGVTSLTGSLMPVIAYAEETPSSPVNVSISDTEVTLENDQIARPLPSMMECCPLHPFSTRESTGL